MWVLPQYHVVAVYVCMTLSMLLNSVLIFFIYKHSAAEFGTYKTIMLLVAVFNIMYSITLAITMPVIHVYDLSFFIFTTGLGSIPKGLDRLLTAVFCSLFAQSLFVLSLQFVYRYVQVVRPSGQFLFKGRSYILVALYLFTAVDYGAVCFFNFGPSPMKEEYFASEVKHWYKLDITDIGYLGPIYALNGKVQWLDVSGLLNVSILIDCTFALILFCGIATYRSLYKYSATSERTKQRQRQMFRLLLIQSIFPLTFTFVPSSAILVMSLFGRHIGTSGNIVGVLFAVYPVIEPIVVLYFVNTFREAFRRYFGATNRISNPASCVAKF